MTEKEKMLSQQLYRADLDETLIKERCVCKNLCKEYNSLDFRDVAKREKIIKQIFGKTGKNITVEPYFWCDYGYNITVR